MAVRQESVRLSLDDAGFTSGMAKAAAATALLDKQLNSLDGSHVQTSKSSDALAKSSGALAAEVDKTARSVDQGGASIDKFSGRLSLLAQAASVLGPALIPIGAVGVPALTGLATAATAGAAAGGSLIVAFQGVGDALKAMNEQALNPSAENIKALREAMDKLGPDAREFVHEFQAFRPVLSDIRDSAAAGWFPGLIESLDDFAVIGPKVADLFELIGRTGGEMVADTAASFNSDRWMPFFDFVTAELPSALTSLGKTVGDLTHGAAELWMAFDPANDSFLSWLEGVATGFDSWASSAGGREDVAAFLAYVRETGPQVEELFLSIVNALTQVTQAAAPLGGPVLSALSGIFDVIAKIADSDLGTPIFAGLAALSLYNRALATTAALQKSAFGQGLAGAATGASATGAIGRSIGGLKTELPTLREFGTVMFRAGQSAENASASTLAARESVARLRPAMAAGAAAGGLLALSMTDLDEKAGLANAAMGAMAGLMIGGPWGAAIGAGVGLTIDFVSATDDLAEALSNVETAVSGGSIIQSLSAVQPVLDNLNITLDELLSKDIQGQLFGTQENIDVPELTSPEQIAQVEAFLDLYSQVVAIGPQVADALNVTIGPVDGSAASFRELESVMAQAAPTMDRLRITQSDMTLAWKVSTGSASVYEAALASLNPTFDEMLSSIAGGTSANDRYSGTMREAAQAARAEAAALRASVSAMQEKTAAALGAFDAETRYRQALKAATDESKKNTAGIRGNSDAALDNRSRLSALASAWDNQSAAVKNNVDRYRAARQAFISAAMDMGVTASAARNLADKYLEIPKSVVTKIEARGAAEAEAEAARVQRALDNIRDRTVFIRTINTSVAAARDPSFPLATKGSADGSTVPRDGGPYRDYLPYLLADGEEVISNRYGQADRHRSLLKVDQRRLADGGTAGLAGGERPATPARTPTSACSPSSTP